MLNELKQIRDELRDSSKRYDNAFKNAAIIAAEELSERENKLELDSARPILSGSTSSLDKQYFLNKYGSLKNTKDAYTKMYGKQKYGRSWSDFITVASKLSCSEKQRISLEDRITKIESFLATLGYQP